MGDSIAVSKYRKVWIDVLKGIGALGVIFAHSWPPDLLLKPIFCFILPVFFIITGYLWKPQNVLVYLKRFILPYFILCAVNLLIQVITLLLRNEEIPIGKYIIGILYSRDKEEWMPNCLPLWYLTCIFCALVLFGFIQKLNSEPVKILLIIAAITVSGLLSYFKVMKLPWNLDSAMMSLVFIYAGLMIKKLDILEKMRKLSVVKQVLFLVFTGTAGLFFVYMNPVLVSFGYNRYGNVIFMLSGALTLSFITFYLCYRIPWKGPVAKYLAYLGMHTIFVLGFDYFFGSIARNVIGLQGVEDWAPVFIFKVVALSVTCLVWNWCVGKIKNKPIRDALSY